MIAIEQFNKTEQKLITLAKMWNQTEQDPLKYDMLFQCNAHELAQVIGNGTRYTDWQEFLQDSRVQEYVDSILYVQAGILITQLMSPNAHLSQADSARLSTAIKYRDDHKADFATPVQYIYMQTPLTFDEKEFLPGGS